MKKLLAALLCIMLAGCVHKNHSLILRNTMTALPSVLPHGTIVNVVDNVFYVMGSNEIVHEGVRIQASRTMTIIRENGDLTLVNAIRLNDAGLRELEKLGRIKNVIRLGAFHGRDDAFYQQAYRAKLWSFPQMATSHGEVMDVDLSQGQVPVAKSRIIELKSTKFKEALLFLEQSGGILISCDSIKNWLEKDEFFDEATFKMMNSAGSIGRAKIDATWLQAMSPSKAEMLALGQAKFSILMSAHGHPLRENAKEHVRSSIENAVKSLPISQTGPR